MSAQLSPQLDMTYVAADRFDKFFSQVEVKKIQNTLEPREQRVMNTPSESCKINLFFGFFFDGTRNNYKQAESDNNHSNIARLYDCYPGWGVPGVVPKSADWKYHPEQFTHFFKVYAPGVASPFEEVGDSGKGVQETLGGASGALGERRIIWALIQAINNVHRYFFKTPLVSQPEADRLLKCIILNQHSRKLMEETAWWSGYVPNKDVDQIARQEFKELLCKLHKAVSLHWPNEKTGTPARIDPGIVKTIYVSVFGFSRGAAQARAFTNWFLSLCRLDAKLCGRHATLSLGGFPVQFDFLGIFDTVASVGLGNTLGNSYVGRLLDGHSAWADAEDSLRIPDEIKCLHLVSAHELRRSFPLDSISVGDRMPALGQEIVLPGVHSDVGCGYCPREQGRGTDENGDDMLARIPLLMMYKAARLSGVPLKLELANDLAQKRFALKAETIKAFNAYIATCKETSGPLYRIMREQARKQIEWRLVRRTSGASPIQSSASFLRASTFHQNDLYSAAREFEEELAKFDAWLKEKGKGFKPVSQKVGFDEHEAEWEEIATWWKKGPMPSAEVMNFFDNYVHDSRASFKLIPGNPETEEKMHELLASWVKRRKAAQVNKQMQAKMPAWANAKYMQRGDGLSEDERRAADEYAKTGAIPRMITEGREPYAFGRAGYLRFRKIYGGLDSKLISSINQPYDAMATG
jgi:Uncharacterized alpha/beta hydrolase domain (DUF2235)